jgi:hypothetical protein
MVAGSSWKARQNDRLAAMTFRSASRSTSGVVEETITAIAKSNANT